MIDRGSDKLAVPVAAKFIQKKPHQTLGGFKTISDDLANANAVKNAKPTGLCVSPFSLDRFGYIDALYR